MEHFQAILISIKIVKDYIALLIISLLNKGNCRYIFRFKLGKKWKFIGEKSLKFVCTSF